jgi:formylmethanofuran dehydrogenase subunit D
MCSLLGHDTMQSGNSYEHFRDHSASNFRVEVTQFTEVGIHEGQQLQITASNGEVRQSLHHAMGNCRG